MAASAAGTACNGPGFQGYATRADINEGFALNGLQNGQTSIRDAVTSGFHGVDTAMCNLGYQTQAGFNAMGAQLASCCCDTREAIQGVRYEPRHHRLRYAEHHPEHHSRHHRQRQRQQPGDFGFPDPEQIATLQAENQSLKLAASQANQNSYLTATLDAQTNELIAAISPSPVPAYQVPNPYTGCCGYNNCGC